MSETLGRKYLSKCSATASGTVLDLGPGTGCLVAKFNPELIDQAYGAEPAVDMHPELQKNIDAAHLTEKYKALPCGAEPTSLIPCLAKEGLFGTAGVASEGVFDTIVCTRVLCGGPGSIPGHHRRAVSSSEARRTFHCLRARHQSLAKAGNSRWIFGAKVLGLFWLEPVDGRLQVG